MKDYFSASIVVFDTDFDILKCSIESYLNAEFCGKLYLIDNSKYSKYQKFSTSFEGLHYIKNPSNPGYGASHNIALKANIGKVQFHLILNPDIQFSSDTLKLMAEFYQSNDSIGILAPQAINVDGSYQSNGRLVPSAFDLILKRLGLFKVLRPYYYSHYMNLKFHGDNYLTPVVLGSFMMFSDEKIREIGFFDERFFLYPEDIDLSRRFSKKYDNYIIGKPTFFHNFKRQSYSSFRLGFVHAFEMIKYFNKWGWIFDYERDQINSKIK
jgi:GT2 family glycosyltransferase